MTGASRCACHSSHSMLRSNASLEAIRAAPLPSNVTNQWLRSSVSRGSGRMHARPPILPVKQYVTIGGYGFPFNTPYRLRAAMSSWMRTVRLLSHVPISTWPCASRKTSRSTTSPTSSPCSAL